MAILCFYRGGGPGSNPASVLHGIHTGDLLPSTRQPPTMGTGFSPQPGRPYVSSRMWGSEGGGLCVVYHRTRLPSNRSYTFVDKHRCQLGYYDRSSLVGIYVYLQKCMTGSTVSAYGDIRRTNPRLHFPTYDCLRMVAPAGG